MKDQFEVNPQAEVVGNSIAKAVLTICIICAVICLIAGIIICCNVDGKIGAAVMISSLVLVIVGIVYWAIIMIFVNISRSLYNINNALRGRDREEDKDEGKTETIVEKKEVNEAIYVEGSPFQAGQLVVIKGNEDQFRINKVVEENGKFYYYSEKFKQYYSPEAIEDFDKYWAKKNK